MSRSELQTRRMYNYFIEATEEVIRKEGTKNITVRKVADLAGFTGSTIYNYFDEFSHLVFFASMRLMEGYNEDLADYMSKAEDSLEKYFLAWDCFYKHSFLKPDIFNIIFLSDLGSNPNELINRYYTIYENELNRLPEQLRFIVLENDLFSRNHSLLYDAVKDRNISQTQIDSLLSITILTWKGMLVSLINNRVPSSPVELAEQGGKYVRELTLHFLNESTTVNEH